MAVQPIVSSPNTTQPSSDGLDLQACDSILGQTSSPMPLGSASGLPDSTCPGESLLESDNRVSKEVRKKIKRTSNTHTGSNKYSNRKKAQWHVASMLAATALGLVLAPLTAGASLFPTIGALVIMNSAGMISYGGRTFYMATPENGKTSEKEHAPPATLEGAPDDEGQKGTTQDRNAPGYSDPVYIFIDNSRIITNNGSSSAASKATGEGVGISVNTQTSDEFFSKLSQVGVEVTTQPMTADQLRAFITSSANKSELVDRLLDNHALNGDTVIIAQVSDPNIGILRAVITVPNELLPHDAPSAESQTLIPQAAQLDASGGWIRDENGWRELKETPPVFTTQGSTSARDAMWRRSVEESGSSSSTDNPPQIPEKYEVSRKPPSVASKDLTVRHWTVNTPDTVTTEGAASGLARNHTQVIFNNVKGIEEFIEQERMSLSKTDDPKPKTLDIIRRRNVAIAARHADPRLFVIVPPEA